jgi:hypothetical protein
MKCCKICGKEIPEQRLKALPTAETCVKCSTTEKIAGFQLITGKTTYTELQLVSQDAYKKLIEAQERIGSSPGNGIIKNE